MRVEMLPVSGGSGGQYYSAFQDGSGFDATTKKLTVGFTPKVVMIKCGYGGNEMTVVYDYDTDQTKYIQYNAGNAPVWYSFSNTTYGIRSIDVDGVTISDNFYANYVSKTTGNSRPQWIIVCG